MLDWLFSLEARPIWRHIARSLETRRGVIGFCFRAIKGTCQFIAGLARTFRMLLSPKYFAPSRWLPVRLHRNLDAARPTDGADRATDDRHFLYEDLPPAIYDEQLNSDVRMLLPWAGRKLGISGRALSRRLTKVYAVHTPELNGFVRHAADWSDFEIVVNAGVLNSVHHFTVALSSAATFIDDNGRQTESRAVPLGTIAPYVKCLLDEMNGERTGIIPADILSNLTSRQLTLASMLSDASRLFVPAHEFGHIILHASKAGCVEAEYGRLTAEMFGNRTVSLNRPEDKRFYVGNLVIPDEQFQALTDSERDKLIRDWSEEFAADLIGLRLSIAAQTEDYMLRLLSEPGGMSSKERRRLAPCVALGGIEIVLILLDLAERYSMHRHGPRTIDSHPSAYMRLANVRTAARAWGRTKGDPLAEGGENLADLGNAFGSVSDRVLNRILSERF